MIPYLIDDASIDLMTAAELELTLFWIDRLENERGGRGRNRGAPALIAA